MHGSDFWDGTFRFEKELKDLYLRFQQDLAYAVRTQPDRRRELLRISGRVHQHLVLIREIFGGQPVDEILPPPECHWFDYPTLTTGDLWLLQSAPGAPAIELWGTRSSSAAEMINRVFVALTVVLRQADGQNGEVHQASFEERYGRSHVYISTREKDTDTGPAPYVWYSWDQGGASCSVSFLLYGPKAPELRYPHEFDHVDLEEIAEEIDFFATDPESTSRPKTVAVVKGKQQELEHAVMEITSRRRVTAAHVETLRSAMVMSAEYTHVCLSNGYNEPFPELIACVETTIGEIDRVMRGEFLIDRKELWEGVAIGLAPRRQSAVDYWNALAASVDKKLVLPPDTSHKDERKFQIGGIATELGLSESQLRDRRRDAKARIGKQGQRVPMTVVDLEKTLRYIIKVTAGSEDPDERALHNRAITCFEKHLWPFTPDESE